MSDAAGAVTSGDECCTRRLTSTLGSGEAPDVMPAYRLPGLREDDDRPPGVLPWVETPPPWLGVFPEGSRDLPHVPAPAREGPPAGIPTVVLGAGVGGRDG
ncbi:hypothetical protein GCM10019017_65300 [Streptomyces showdoensis]